MTGARLRVDLPGGWTIDLGASTRGVTFDLAPPAPTPSSSPPAPPVVEAPRVEGGAVLDAERAPYGFTLPRWSPLEGTDPDP